MSTCVAETQNGNVGLAFGIVTAAGLSTSLGAAVAFFMPYKRDSKNLFLAGCLSIAAGVMVYVSFMEIFATKAIDYFAKCVEENLAYLYATLCFFGGILITYLFDMSLHLFEDWISQRKHASLEKKQAIQRNSDIKDTQSSSQESLPPVTQPVSNVLQGDDQESSDIVLPVFQEPSLSEPRDEHVKIDPHVGHDGHMVADMYQAHSHDPKALIRMGIFAGIALAFHNFPEGLATFVAVLTEPSIGISVAIAIGIHNIPEGICVAMPIYYATGSRYKAFMWATLSGMTELLGAFLGWVVLRKVITPLVYGILFGIVAGMMIYISIKELLPTAHRYDPDDKVTTYSFIAGMLLMAISLVLFMF
ncbi:unnamed protein product [Agarophyton chilense]